MARFFTNMAPGVVVQTDPYIFVPVGNETGRHVRIACGKKTPPEFTKKRVEGMQFERLHIDRGSIMRLKPKIEEPVEGEEPRPAQRERILLVNERDNDKENAIVLATLPSGYKGDSVINVHDRAQIIADCFVSHGIRGALGVTHHVLAFLSPGGELRGQVTGHRVKSTHYRWIYDGEEIVMVDGGEDVFYNASEHTARLNEA